VLLNGYPESQAVADFDNDIEALGVFPRIGSCFTGENVDAVEGELSCVYKGRLERFTRSFVYVRPNYLVLHDELAAKNPETFTWLFHAKGTDSIAGSGDTVRIERPCAELRMELFPSTGLNRVVKPYPDQDGSFIMLTTDEPAATARLTTVLIPSTTESRTVREGWTAVSVEGGGWSGVRVTRGGLTDLTAFRTGPGKTTRAFQGIGTDGDRWSVTCNSGGIVRAWVRGAREFYTQDDSGNDLRLLVADKPVTAEVSYGDGGFRTLIATDMAVRVKLHCEKKTERVLLDGRRVRFTYDAGAKELSVDVPAGGGRLRAE